MKRGMANMTRTEKLDLEPRKRKGKKDYDSIYIVLSEG